MTDNRNGDMIFSVAFPQEHLETVQTKKFIPGADNSDTAYYHFATDFSQNGETEYADVSI